MRGRKSNKKFWITFSEFKVKSSTQLEKIQQVVWSRVTLNIPSKNYLVPVLALPDSRDYKNTCSRDLFLKKRFSEFAARKERYPDDGRSFTRYTIQVFKLIFIFLRTSEIIGRPKIVFSDFLKCWKKLVFFICVQKRVNFRKTILTCQQTKGYQKGFHLLSEQKYPTTYKTRC